MGSPQQQPPYDYRYYRRHRPRSIAGPIVLVLIGVAFLLGNMHIVSAARVAKRMGCSGGRGVTGWLGGELVDRLGIGVDEGANPNAPSSLRSENPRRAA